MNDVMAGAWVAGSLAALAECIPDAVAMLFVNGPDAPSLDSSAARGLMMVAGLRGAALRATASSDPTTAMCFTFVDGEVGAVVANLTPDPIEAELGQPGTRQALEPYQVLTTRWP